MFFPKLALADGAFVAPPCQAFGTTSGTCLQGIIPGTVAFQLSGANFNSTADQPIAITLPTGFTRYRIANIIISNPSISMTTATGGFYTAASKGGAAIVPAAQTYSGLTNNTPATTGSQAAATVTNLNTAFYNNTTIFFSLTLGQGAAATADITILVNALP